MKDDTGGKMCSGLVRDYVPSNSLALINMKPQQESKDAAVDEQGICCPLTCWRRNSTVPITLRRQQRIDN